MLNFENLDRMIEQKYISVQKHPSLDLFIYNYTHRAAYDRVWNNETLQCRGLIMDGNRNIVSRPFKKFFNLGEHEHAAWFVALMERISEGREEEFTVTEKMDGSLGISYFDPEHRMHIATRGSFVSDQAQKANQLYVDKGYYNIDWDPEYTYLFEIIYPGNRIVVNYGDMEDLVLLAVIDTNRNKELDYDTIVHNWGRNIPVVKRHDGITDFKEIIQQPNSEGYVVHFPKTGLRFKVKFDEYVRLHRILTGINAKRIWEILSAGQSLDDILDRVPDEFYQWVEKTVEKLRTEHAMITMEAMKLHNQVRDLPTRKEQALAIKDSPLRSLVFSMLDGKDTWAQVWKMIEPKYEPPFKVDEI